MPAITLVEGQLFGKSFFRFARLRFLCLRLYLKQRERARRAKMDLRRMHNQRTTAAADHGSSSTSLDLCAFISAENGDLCLIVVLVDLLLVLAKRVCPIGCPADQWQCNSTFSTMFQFHQEVHRYNHCNQGVVNKKKKSSLPPTAMQSCICCQWGPAYTHSVRHSSTRVENWK